jgi:hypothetical protein
MDIRKLVAKHDEALVARSLLVGMARLGVLSAGTPEALDLVQDVANAMDYRDEIPDRFGELLSLGVIRTDAQWTDPIDETLVTLYRGQSPAATLGRKMEER